MKKILIATHNPWKTKLFGSIFQQYGFDVYSPVTLGPSENGRTVVENALIKARHYSSPEHQWVFGDDTGLEIDALGGAPGVQFRRWAGHFTDDVPDEIWLNHLLALMNDIPAGKRTAHLVDGWALITPGGKTYSHETRATFEIAMQPLRPIIPGSPILSVSVGLPDDPALIFAALQTHWKTWGISDVLRQE